MPIAVILWILKLGMIESVPSMWLAILPRWRSDGRENEKEKDLWAVCRDDLVRTLIVNSDTTSSPTVPYYLEMIHGDPSFWTRARVVPASVRFGS